MKQKLIIAASGLLLAALLVFAAIAPPNNKAPANEITASCLFILLFLLFLFYMFNITGENERKRIRKLKFDEKGINHPM